MSGPILTSSLLTRAKIPHAFSTRQAGVSSGPFDSLNFGNPSDLSPEHKDPPANIQGNFRRLLEALRTPERRVVQVHQVHGPDIRVIRRDELAAGPARAADAPQPDPRADAIVTDDPGVLACIRVADCAPVLLASSDGAVVAAVHAGWRGIVAEVVPRTIDAMRAFGAARILASVGPCISVDHFEVGPEVVDAFRAAFPARPPIRPATDPAAQQAGKAYVDLKYALRQQLVDAGLTDIDVLPHCTVRSRDLFFSHRRDAGLTGRMVGIIGPR